MSTSSPSQPFAVTSMLQVALGDTIDLPFWDDFSKYKRLDTTLWDFGKDVYINGTQAINPPTVNVATFDGINSLGQPYQESAVFNGPSDSLVSKPINLSGLEEDIKNTVYLSFYWQLKGLGEIPNEEDSLRISFLDSSNRWIVQDINPDRDLQSLTGGLSNLVFDSDSVQVFQQIILQVSDTAFFHAGFKFKFESFTSLNGVYDSWHIDYVYLNSHRNASDLTHFDRAISSKTTSLFYPYVSITTDEYLANTSQYTRYETVVLSNLDNSFHPARFSYQVNNLSSGASGTLNFVVPADLQPLEQGRQVQITNYTLPPVEQDSTIIETEIVYITGDKRLFEEVNPAGDTVFLDPDLTSNDTLRSLYTIHNYLAYDDGSAEFAAGINLFSGQLAVAFVLNEPDTLTDISIQFPSISPSSVGESLTIKVWTDLDNTALLREVGGIIEASQRDEFQTFSLSSNPVIVSDTFYIGFEQFTDNYIGVGFDRNNQGGAQMIYSNTNRDWTQNDRLEGSLMIRPIFKNSDFILSLKSEIDLISFYPNPSIEVVQFDRQMDQVQIYSLAGILLKEYHNSDKIDISNLSDGVYILFGRSRDLKISDRLIIR
ncbi:MAG: hypothetical protein ACI92W_001846 [Paraglaciecola sp.]